MSTNYKIIGQDGREYGPATAPQIQQWIGEGRLERQTPIFVDGAKDWNFVGLLPEFAGFFETSTPPPLIAPLPRVTPSSGSPAKANSYAVAGMIFGILAVMCCFCFPFGVLGIIFSIIGLSQINANPLLQAGRGMAIAGLILSILSLLMGGLGLVANLVTIPTQIPWSSGHF